MADKNNKMVSFVTTWGTVDEKKGIVIDADVEALSCLMFFPTMQCDRCATDKEPIMIPYINVNAVGILKKCSWNDVKF